MGSKNMIVVLLRILRPTHWVKNVVVFVALVFSTQFFDLTSDLRTLVAFILFCLTSSSVYILNDIADVKQDRKHPKKAKRPIASGQVTISSAITVAAGLAVISLATGWWLDPYFAGVLALYWTANLLYSFGLKRVVVLDVMLIALGFVLRAVGGAVAIHVHISPWLVVTTMFLALFLGFSKRKAELMLLGKEAESTRTALHGYTWFIWTS